MQVLFNAIWNAVARNLFMIVENMRWFTFLSILFSASAVGLAEQPPIIALANQELASLFAASVNHNFQCAVLSASEEEDITLLNRRALAMRSARIFVYESHGETMLQAMYRERLKQQGVKVIDVSSVARRRTSASQVEMQQQLPSLLSALQLAP